MLKTLSQLKRSRRPWTPLQRRTWLAARRRKRHLLPPPLLRTAYPDLLVWDWDLPNPYKWNVWQSLNGGVSYFLAAGYWMYGDARQFAPDGGGERHFIVGVNESGDEITQRSNVVVPDDAAPVISSLASVSGLLDEHVADPAFLSGWVGLSFGDWDPFAGDNSAPMYYASDGDGMPQFVANAFGPGRNAVRFIGGKMTGDWAVTTADLTCAFVARVDSHAVYSAYPRIVSAARYSASEEDWTSPDTWVIGCYDSVARAFVADRNGTRPLSLPFDRDTDYIVATRKQGGTITAWARPFGGITSRVSGATDSSGLNFDTLLFGGNNEPQNFGGLLAHVGLWGRALTDTEVMSVINYLGSRYE
jgi:hypothetical protein